MAKGSDVGKDLLILLDRAQVHVAHEAELRSFAQALVETGDAQVADTLRLMKTREARRAESTTPRRRRGPQDVSQGVKDLIAKLRSAFGDDSTFEQTVDDASKLPKAAIVEVYNGLFETSKKFPKSVTKPDLLNALRRERIARVRYRG